MKARTEDQDQGQCKRGCCWTPFAGSGICPKKHECDHHKQAAQFAVEREIADFAAAMQVADTKRMNQWIR